MITINTRDFGEIEVDEESVFDFPNGIFAFEDSKQFALLSPLGDDVYPKWLQSTTATTPCFIVFDPSVIDAGYRLNLSDNERKFLEIKEDTEVRVLSLASVPEDYRDTTVNMKSPVVINTVRKIAAQVILSGNYEFRLPIYRHKKLKSVGETGAV
ncbi:MAG: flagellar assembly protein FliW [Oscillospiraceae bacterium]|nr:flagellar assembly protein FliW [Oscillospiraceae bacterium]